MRVRKRCDRHLAVANILRRHVGPALIGNEGKVIGRANQVRNGKVDLDKVGEVGEGKPVAQRVNLIAGEPAHHAVFFRQPQHCFRLNGTFKMDVNFCFWHGLDESNFRRGKRLHHGKIVVCVC